VRPADIDETPRPDEDPQAYVARIAREKAAAVARQPGQWSLAADTTVTIDGKILGKAESPAEATQMLQLLSGREHHVATAFCVRGDAGHRDGLVLSTVVMIEMSPEVIEDYVASGEWRGKAGAYAIQGIGAALVREVRGSVTNVIGLPLVEVLEALSAMGAPSARLAAGQPQ
jgi:septum formation protein